MVAPSLTPRGYPGDYPVSTNDIADGAVNYSKVDAPLKKVVIVVTNGKVTSSAQDVVYDWTLPSEWQGKLQVQSVDVRDLLDPTYSKNYRVDGVDSPSLPVTANTSLGVKFHTYSSTEEDHYLVEARFVCEIIG